MPKEITIEMDGDFLEWFKTTALANDKSKMLIAWWGWEACKKEIGRRFDELVMFHKEGR